MKGLERLAAFVEVFLFIKGNPVSMDELVKALAEEPGQIEKALSFLQEKYERMDSGLMVRKSGAGWMLATKREYDSWITETLGKESALSAAALETLAVVAMKEPVTRADIEKIRGVSVGRVLATLLEKDLVEERGRLDVIGRPILYGTTGRFLKCVGLSHVDELKLKWADKPNEGELF